MSELFVIDAVVIQGHVFGNLKASHTTTARVARKNVLGGRKPHEKIGKGDKKFSLSGKIAPYELGGLPDANNLEQACDDSEPVYVTRGDGTVLGWYQITTVDMRDRHIGDYGIGRVIDITIEMEKTVKPSKAGALARLGSLMERLGL